MGAGAYTCAFYSRQFRGTFEALTRARTSAPQAGFYAKYCIRESTRLYANLKYAGR